MRCSADTLRRTTYLNPHWEAWQSRGPGKAGPLVRTPDSEIAGLITGLPFWLAFMLLGLWREWWLGRGGFDVGICVGKSFFSLSSSPTAPILRCISSKWLNLDADPTTFSTSAWPVGSRTTFGSSCTCYYVPYIVCKEVCAYPSA